MNDNRSNPFANAIRGIIACYRSERNFKVHLICATTATALGIWIELTPTEWLWICLCIAVVFVSELLNTAIETVVDLVSPTFHPLAKKAKDAAAGAVLVAAIFAALAGAIIFIPKLYAYFLHLS
jgi:Diacylglycerol kinase